MTGVKQSTEKSSDEIASVSSAPVPDQSRREILATAGRFAAYTAPAMIVLLSPEDAAACHSQGKDDIGCPSP